MSENKWWRWLVLALLILFALTLAAPLAHAASPLGIGSAEPGFNTTGIFGGLFAWINAQQVGFYRLMTGALKEMRGTPWAAATLVGQNLGAKQPERAERSVWITGWVTMGFMAFVSLFYFFLSVPLMRIFTEEPGVVAAGAQCLRIVSCGYIIFAWGLVMPQAFNGAGDTWTPTKINFVCFWLIEIPLAYLLAITFDVKQSGIFWSIVIGESCAGLLAIWLFRKGTWKTTKV